MKLPGIDISPIVGEFREAIGGMTALLQECRDLLRQIRDFQQGLEPAPRFSEGQRVRVRTEAWCGEFAGRHGQVYQVDADTLTVELDPPGRPDDPNEPVMVKVFHAAVVPA